MTKYALVENNVVTAAFAETAFPLSERFTPDIVAKIQQAPDTVKVGFTVLADGKFMPPSTQASAPAPEQIQASKTSAVQAHLDSKAKALGYDSIASAITYAEEPAVAKFQAEGQALRAWRSLVWQACYQLLDDVNKGLRPIPTDAELISALPELAL